MGRGLGKSEDIEKRKEKEWKMRRIGSRVIKIESELMRINKSRNKSSPEE